MTKLLRYLVLPKEVSPFEANYLRRMNKIALAFFALHPPVFVLIALLAGSSPVVALELSVAALAGPALAYFAFRDRPRMTGLIYGVAAMLMGGALVYVGTGPMQIEMHFYFFVLLALLAVFGNPMVIIAATVTVALHHFVVWLVLPRAVFNYDASFWTVVVHAVFVIIEAVAACFVARSFFDNVIGLEKIVAARTSALDGRNRDMTRILDNVAQGFVSVGVDGKVGNEWSRALETWFGAPTPGMLLWDYLYEEATARRWMEVGFESVADGFMPLELVLDQLPHRITRGSRELEIDYLAIDTPTTALLVVVSDITAEVARQQAESAQRELMTAIEKALKDRSGFAAFVAETDELVVRCTSEGVPELELMRRVHTLKGNAALFGISSVAALCHAIEDGMKASGQPPDGPERAKLSQAWTTIRERLERLLGVDRRALVIDLDEYKAMLAGVPADSIWAARLRDWGNAPTRPRLEQCAEYATSLATRLGKPAPTIDVRDHGVRIPNDRFAGMWAAFVHAVRNMVDHGIEDPAERNRLGKPDAGKLVLETQLVNGELHLTITDDGAGIDWERLAAKASALGLPTATRAQLEDAMFAAGVSTRSDVTETSGRGVGMDALRTTCRELGGRIEIESERGTGTRFTCIVPVLRSRRPSARISQNIPILA